jgi:hypothetical protein
VCLVIWHRVDGKDDWMFNGGHDGEMVKVLARARHEIYVKWSQRLPEEDKEKNGRSTIRTMETSYEEEPLCTTCGRSDDPDRVHAQVYWETRRPRPRRRHQISCINSRTSKARDLAGDMEGRSLPIHGLRDGRTQPASERAGQ